MPPTAVAEPRVPSFTPAPLESEPAHAPASKGFGAHWVVLAIIVAGCLAFGHVLADYFVGDDFQLLERAAHSPWWAAFRHWPSFEGLSFYWMAPINPAGPHEPAYFRPLEDLAYWANFRLWGLNPLPYHLLSLGVHLLCSVLVFQVARRFTRRIEFAGLAGVLFALHPAHAEAVQWIAALSDPLATTFILLAFLSWLPRDRKPPPGSPWLPLVWYALALLCKETAVTLPVLLWTAAMVLPERSSTPFWPRALGSARRLLPFWVLTAVYLVLHVGNSSTLLGGSSGDSYFHGLGERGFVGYALFNLGGYLASLAIPVPIFPLDVRDMIGSSTLIGGIAVLMLGAVFFVGRQLVRRRRPALFFALWTVIAVLPALPVAPGQRFLYLPSVGFCLALALFAERQWKKAAPAQRTRWIAVTAALAVVWIGLANLYQAFWGVPASITRTLAADVRASVSKLPPNSEIYLVNLWSPAVRLPSALGLELGDPSLHVEVLTCSPKVLPLREGGGMGPLEQLFSRFVPSEYGLSRPVISWADARRLRLSLPGGEHYGATLMESMLPTRTFQSGATVERERFTARVMQAEPEGIRALEFHFRTAAPRRFFAYANGHLHPLPAAASGLLARE